MAGRSITATIAGGKALEKHLRTIAAKMGRGAAVNVGFLEDATYPVDADNPKSSRLPVAQVAFWNEFGTAKTPPRPFLRNTVASKSPRWGNALGANLRATNYDVPQTMALMGEGIKGQVVQSIVQFKDPPNSARTIARKGFDKPLIDTGVMQRSVDFEVLDGSTE